jgi:hypothetical protein
LILSHDNKRFIKRYISVFLEEIKHFITSFNLKEEIEKKGAAYTLIKQNSSPGGDISTTEDPTP